MRNRRGSILVAVLWSLFFLAMIAVAISAYVRPQMEFSSRLSGATKMYYIARAGVQRAIFEAENDITDDYDSLSDSWSANDEAFNNVSFGDGAFSVVKAAGRRADIAQAGGSKEEYGLTDEESRININKAPHDVLKNLFEKNAGIPEKDADAIADAILDWVDKDDSLHKDGKEDGYYQSLSDPYHCKNAPFEAVEELLLVGGVTRESFDKVKDIITIYGDGTVNVNTAGAGALEALGLSKEASEAIIGFRSEQNTAQEGEVPDNVFTDASMIAEVLNKADVSDQSADITRAAVMLGVKSDNFRGVVKGTLGRGSRSETITFVYDRKDKLIKYWREE